MAEMEATILGGLPVVVDLEWEDADRSVGIMRGGWIAGTVWLKRISKRGKVTYRRLPPSMETKIAKSGDYERLQAQADDYEG